MRNGKLSRRAMLKASTALAAGAIGTQSLDAFAQPSAVQAALIARAKSFELDTPYVPPPGNALEHHASGFAKIMCSAVFVTGLDPDFAAENVGYFTAPYEVRHKLGKPVAQRIDLLAAAARAVLNRHAQVKERQTPGANRQVRRSRLSVALASESQRRWRGRLSSGRKQPMAASDAIPATPWVFSGDMRVVEIVDGPALVVQYGV
jgi:hypothetical protein